MGNLNTDLNAEVKYQLGRYLNMLDHRLADKCVKFIELIPTQFMLLTPSVGLTIELSKIDGKTLADKKQAYIKAAKEAKVNEIPPPLGYYVTNYFNGKPVSNTAVKLLRDVVEYNIFTHGIDVLTSRSPWSDELTPRAQEIADLLTGSGKVMTKLVNGHRVIQVTMPNLALKYYEDDDIYHAEAQEVIKLVQQYNIDTCNDLVLNLS